MTALGYVTKGVRDGTDQCREAAANVSSRARSIPACAALCAMRSPKSILPHFALPGSDIPEKTSSRSGKSPTVHRQLVKKRKPVTCELFHFSFSSAQSLGEIPGHRTKTLIGNVYIAVRCQVHGPRNPHRLSKHQVVSHHEIPALRLNSKRARNFHQAVWLG